MEQDGQGFMQTYRNYVIAGIIVVLAIIFFATRDQQPDQEDTQEEQTAEQNSGDSMDGMDSEKNQAQENQNDSANQNQTTAPSTESNNVASGNVSATGTLRTSDTAAKGNLMVESNRGKIYIATARDFSSLVGKSVTLNAQGSLESFVFLGFKEATDAPAPAPAPEDQASDVDLSGKLELSDDQTKGNYIINSSGGKIYLKTQHNYANWVGSEVRLTANGNINSFTGAKLSKK